MTILVTLGSKPPAESITRGSGNFFADLGFPGAEERQTKLRLAFAINRIVEERGLTQQQKRWLRQDGRHEPEPCLCAFGGRLIHF